MWTVRFDRGAFKDLSKLSKTDQNRVTRFIDDRLLKLENPRQLGGPLKGSLSEYWRYRVGDIRIVCRIDDGELVLLVVAVGNRGAIYR